MNIYEGTYSKRQAQKEMGVSRYCLDKLIEQGDIRLIRIAGWWRIPEQAITDYLARLEREKAGL